MPFANLPSKPSAPLVYDFFSGDSSLPLVIFINGLGLPAASWKPSIKLISEDTRPPLLIYDRFGQGETTARDPLDTLPGKEPGYGHTIEDSLADLGELLDTIGDQVDHDTGHVLVAASIGVHIARLYTEKHPQRVRGLLFLDANIGNIEFDELWPDPRAPDFREEEVLADDCSIEQYIAAFDRFGSFFRTDARNGEALDRRNIKKLLPYADQPKLKRADGSTPWLTVVEHEPRTFELQSHRDLGAPISITRKFTQPTWKKYHADLTKLSNSSGNVIVAPETGHFIQKDNPAFVAEQLLLLLDTIAKRD